MKKYSKYSHLMFDYYSHHKLWLKDSQQIHIRVWAAPAAHTRMD